MSTIENDEFIRYDKTNLAQALTDLDDPTASQSLRSEVYNMFNDLRKASGENFFRAVDLFLIANPIARNEFNLRAKEQGLPQVNYPFLAKKLLRSKAITEDQYNRASGNLDTLTNPGGQNNLQTTVSTYFEKTVEQLGIIFNTVTKKDLRNGGNLQQPVYSAFGKSAFTTAGAAFTNLGTTIEGGISSVTFNPLPFGHIQSVYTDFVNKLSVSWLQEIIQIMAEQHARAKDDAIINGTGSGQPTGMNQNALVAGTDFPTGTNEFETLINACTAISDKRRIPDSGLVIYGNAAAKNTLIKLKYNMTNSDTAGLIQVDGGNVTAIGGKKFIESEVIVNTGTSPAKSTVLTVGAPKYYYWGYSKEDQILQSTEVGFTSDTLTLKASGLADGKPVFNNAFAKVTFTNVA